MFRNTCVYLYTIYMYSMCVYIYTHSKPDLYIIGRCSLQHPAKMFMVVPRRWKEVSVGTSVEDFGFSICSIWIGTCVGNSSLFFGALND